MWPEFICIEGNIGIGKTTLVKKLAGHLGFFAFYEEFEENPFLPLFYEDPEKHALDLELSFLSGRAKQLRRIMQEHPGKSLLSDYSLDKCLLFAQANLAEDQFGKYKELHGEAGKEVRPPSRVIVIHSQVENLQKNIRERNRAYEQKIESAYLQKLNHSYNEFFGTEKAYAVLNIFVSELNEAAYDRILHEILGYLKIRPTFKTTSIEL